MVAGEGLVRALRSEWVWLTEREPGLAALLAEVATAPDRGLGELVRRFQAGDTGAGLAVCQAMLPKMIVFARADARHELGDYLAQLCCVAHRYPLDRRPARVAANLALDTLKATRRAASPQEDSWDALPAWLVERSVPPGDPEPVPDLGVLLAEAEAGGVISAAEQRDLRARYLDGLTPAETAERFGGSAAQVRARCSRARRRLVRFVAAGDDCGTERARDGRVPRTRGRAGGNSGTDRENVRAA